MLQELSNYFHTSKLRCVLKDTCNFTSGSSGRCNRITPIGMSVSVYLSVRASQLNRLTVRWRECEMRGTGVVSTLGEGFQVFYQNYPHHRHIASWIESPKAWPRCKVPVTLGGGSTITNGFSSFCKWEHLFNFVNFIGKSYLSTCHPELELLIPIKTRS